MLTGGMLLGVLSTWVTPTWLLGAGAGLGLLVLALGYGLAWISSARLTAFLSDSLREGFLKPVLILAAVMTVLAAISSPVVPVRDLVRSLVRLPTAGRLNLTETIAANATDQQVDLGVRPSELKELTIEGDRDLTIRLVQYGIIKEAKEGKIQIIAGEPFTWSKARSENNLFYGEATVMSVRNISGKPAQL